MDMLKVIDARESLEAAGLYDALLDEGGEIVPTAQALESVSGDSRYQGASDAELLRLAQAQTLIDLVKPAQELV